MSFIDDLIELIKNIPRPIDYPFTTTQLIIFVSIAALQIICCWLIYITARRKIKSSKMSNTGTNALLLCLLGCSLYPIGGFITYLYRLVIDPANSILFGNTNFFVVVGGGFYAIAFTVYIKEVVNLADYVVKIFRVVFYGGFTLISFITTTMLIHFVYPLNEQFVNVVFALAALALCSFMILGWVFAFIDYFRVSNKLAKVRLGMNIISATIMTIQIAFIGIYFFLTISEGKIQLLLPYTVLFVYGLNIFTALTLYYGFFIPLKLQEWTGILPPSFKALREKQKLLAKQESKA